MLAWMKRTRWMNDHPMYWARIMIALNGLRPGEARGLTWESVKNLNNKRGTPLIIVQSQLGYTNGELKLIPATKTGIPRTVVLNAAAVEALKAWKKIQTGYKRRTTWKPREGMEDLIFTNDTGKPLRQQDDDAQWNALLEQAQKNYKTKITWTMLYNRHIAVSLMRDAGIPASLVAAIMGHTIAVEDEHYYQSQISEQSKAINTLNRFIG